MVFGNDLELAVALALESSESDIARACELLGDTRDPATSKELAHQLLLRAHHRIETVRVAIGEAAP